MDLAYAAALPPAEFKVRRQRLFEQMQPGSALLIFSAIEQRRNQDCCFPFRQESHFWYLTGFNEPHAALLLVKSAEQNKTVVFLRPRDPMMETWNGRRLGVENATAKLNIDEAYAINEFPSIFSKITQNLTALYYAPELQSWGQSLFTQSAVNFTEVFDWQPILSEMRLFKSANEIRLMQQAAQISAFGHIKAMQHIRPNRFEYEIESEILYEFHRFGARYPAYNTIVAGGENACILHYTENDQVLKDGELVLIDAGCEFAMYAGDITRTVPINGRFSTAQRQIYALVLKAQKCAIERLVAGNSIKNANEEVIRLLVNGLIELGILQGKADELIAREAYRRFYMHGLGHWLGLDVHDAGDYGQQRDRPLEVGMVLTVEPGLYIPSDEDIPEAYRGVGVRIEDNLLITEYGNKILTAAAPKEIDEIENLMNSENFLKM